MAACDGSRADPGRARELAVRTANGCQELLRRWCSHADRHPPVRVVRDWNRPAATTPGAGPEGGEAGERRARGARRSRHRSAPHYRGARWRSPPSAPPAAPRTPWSLRTLAEGAYADRALHGEARGLEPRDRALAKQLAFGTVQRRLTLDHVIAAPRRPRARAARARRAAARALPAAVPRRRRRRTPRSARPSSWPSPAPATGSSTPCCAACSARASSCPSDDDARGRGHPPLAPALDRATCGGTGSGADETRALLAADNEPAELALRVNPLVDYDLDDIPGRREGEAIVVDGPFDALAHPGYAAGAFTPQSRASQLVAPRARPAARRARARPVRGARRQDDAPRGAHGRRGRGRRGRAPPRRARALQAHRRAHARRATSRVVDGRRRATTTAPGGFDRVLLDPPCSGPRDAALAPRPALAREPRGHRRAWPPSRTRCSPPRAARWPPAGALVYSVCTLSPARGAARDSDRAAHLPARRRHRRLLYCPRWRLTSGCSARPAASRGCGRRTSPGRYRCVYCLHRFELRSVCPDCGEHSTIVRMSSTATLTCNHCDGSMLVEV